MRRNAEGIGDTIKKSEHCSVIDCFRNLFLFPACVAELLHMLRGCLVSGFRNQLYIFQKGALTRTETSLFKIAVEDRFHALICGSLNTQEVSMAVESIWATIQVRDMTGNHFFVPSRDMSFRKMNGVRELNYLAQEIWSMENPVGCVLSH